MKKLAENLAVADRINWFGRVLTVSEVTDVRTRSGALAGVTVELVDMDTHDGDHDAVEFLTTGYEVEMV